VQATWYYDLISPFAYLYRRQWRRLDASFEARLRPVLFGGILKHWGSIGPAELPTKRIHTYQYCAWQAKKLGVPFVMPSRHPFNPLSALRLMVGIEAHAQIVDRAFDAIWAQGTDPELDFEGFVTKLGVPMNEAARLISDPVVKAQLALNTQEAIGHGVFGVPTLRFDGQNFWGCDSIDWANDFLRRPALFEAPEYQQAHTVAVGVSRKN
jgi:2-hydroxychromene-2-carboxylate isomerase